MAQFTTTTDAYINLPPSAVGDGAESTGYGVTLVYTTAMFTTNTTPVYADPEGDAALELKVLTLPTTGDLEYNATPVILNQIITFADIVLGLLTFVPDNAIQTAYDVTFDFQIADAGSGQFVG